MCAVQVVVQGIPWAYTDEDLAGLFHEVGTVEQASVVYSKDGRSRVSLPLQQKTVFIFPVL